MNRMERIICKISAAAVRFQTVLCVYRSFRRNIPNKTANVNDLLHGCLDPEVPTMHSFTYISCQVLIMIAEMGFDSTKF